MKTNKNLVTQYCYKIIVYSIAHIIYTIFFYVWKINVNEVLRQMKFGFIEVRTCGRKKID